MERHRGRNRGKIFLTNVRNIQLINTSSRHYRQTYWMREKMKTIYNDLPRLVGPISSTW